MFNGNIPFVSGIFFAIYCKRVKEHIERKIYYNFRYRFEKLEKRTYIMHISISIYEFILKNIIQ